MERDNISPILRFIGIIVYVSIITVASVYVFTRKLDAKICTPSEETQQITEKLVAMEENKFYVDNMNDLNMNAIKDRLDNIDKKIDGVGMECADINMNLQQ